MSCYSPLLGVPVEFENGVVKRYQIQGRYEPIAKERIDPRCIKIPCGHCLGCRLDYSRQWADRMILELDHTGKGCFMTLTYNDENVPKVFDDDMFYGLTLSKKDCQDFMKRLRKAFTGTEIRFYACGEYGSNTRRPHMHIICFGISLDDFPDREIKGMNELGQSHFISKKLERIWNKGFCLIADVSYKTCAYVSRYVQKKAFNDLVEWYQEPEFSLMSRRPGIGAYYLKEHPNCIDLTKIYLKDSNGSVSVRPPKYFLNKLMETNNFADAFKVLALKEQMTELASDKELLKLQKTELNYYEMLDIEQEELYNRTKILCKLRA